MSTSRRAPGRPLAFGLIAALAISILPGAPIQLARAATAGLFFSEYVEGTSNNKALEIFNGTGAAINLATGGYDIQMFFNGNPVAGLTIGLTGTVANNDVYVLAQTSASATILAQADQTNGAGWFNGDDAIVLRQGGTIVDSIGQVGFDPGTEWGAGLVSTADNTLRRKPTVVAGDTIPNDVFDPAAQWDGFATDTFDGLGAHTITEGDNAPTVTATVPTDGASNFALNGNVSVTFSEPVNATAGSFAISCDVSGTHTATLSGGPTTYTLNPDADFVDDETCTITVVAANVTDQDTNDPPDNMDADHVVTFSPGTDCGETATAIGAIQGSGSAAAITGNVTVEGVVVGDFEGSAAVSGFYLQDAGDASSATSDGIFVFTGNANTVAAGDVVRVTGYARERFNETTLNGSNSNTSPVTAANITPCGASTIAATSIELPFASLADPERFEGMFVNLPQALVISEYFNYERFGELVLAQPLPGESRAFTPTAVEEPGPDAIARALANSLSRITLDDAVSAQNPAVLRHPNGDPFSLDNRFRGGDTVQNTIGVLGFAFSLYRIYPTAPADYTSVNPRPAAPDPVGGTLRAAAMNTLNFFLTPDYPNITPPNPLDNKCGASQTLECRGADFDQPDEFTRQRDKLLAALAGLDADVIGLNEIENTPNVEPLLDPVNGVVAGLNGMPGVGPYAAIDTGVIGTDAIRVGMIFRSDRVAPVGTFKILNTAVDPRFIDTKSRPVLAQTFEDLATGARFTVAVNHLKSKGSDCNDVSDPDIGDGQGNCNQTRKLAAQALVDWLATDPTGSGDRDYLILGDLNSYAQEDPIDAIRAGADDVAGTADDYTNLIAQYQGLYAHSFVFDGQAGYLDHALASPTLAGQVTGAAEWHINSDEPDLLDYDTSFKPPAQEAIYEPNAYRSSDHDPVVVGLELLNYGFSGFLSPVDNPPVLNTVNAGRTIPIKFTLAQNFGLDVLFGTPTSTPLTCSSGLPSSEVETSTAGGGGLTYDPATGEYTYAWKTDKAWANQCHTFTLTLDDGTYREANFDFMK